MEECILGHMFLSNESVHAHKQAPKQTHSSVGGGADWEPGDNRLIKAPSLQQRSSGDVKFCRSRADVEGGWRDGERRKRRTRKVHQSGLAQGNVAFWFFDGLVVNLF